MTKQLSFLMLLQSCIQLNNVKVNYSSILICMSNNNMIDFSYQQFSFYVYLFQQGASVKSQLMKGILMDGVFDSPARCLSQNISKFNRLFGCQYCL